MSRANFYFFPELPEGWCPVFPNHLPFATDQRDTGMSFAAKDAPDAY